LPNLVLVLALDGTLPLLGLAMGMVHRLWLWQNTWSIAASRMRNDESRAAATDAGSIAARAPDTHAKSDSSWTAKTIREHVDLTAEHEPPERLKQHVLNQWLDVASHIQSERHSPSNGQLPALTGNGVR
jgi:hypothetical protein